MATGCAVDIVQAVTEDVEIGLRGNADSDAMLAGIGEKSGEGAVIVAVVQGLGAGECFSWRAMNGAQAFVEVGRDGGDVIAEEAHGFAGGSVGAPTRERVGIID